MNPYHKPNYLARARQTATRARWRYLLQYLRYRARDNLRAGAYNLNYGAGFRGGLFRTRHAFQYRGWTWWNGQLIPPGGFRRYHNYEDHNRRRGLG